MNLLVELLQVALGTRTELSHVLSDAQWDTLLEKAQEQAIDGVLLCGIEQLPQEQRPPIDILLQWIGSTQIIEAQNAETTKTCISVCEQFKKDGFKTCVLKGQANHAYYPCEMGKRRSCGDVDVWTVPVSEGRCKRDDVRRVLKYVKSEHELTGLCWLHCNFDDENGVPVEVHFRPSFMNEPVHNKRFQQHFADFDRCVTYRDIDGIKIPALRIEYDVIYQMNHIYRHLLDEGVGLRQIVDFYFVLKRFHTGQNIKIVSALQRLGMRRFAGALMWVIKEVCGATDEILLCKPDEKEGRFLLNEIMMAGNFGHFDPRMGGLNTKSVTKRRLSQAYRRFKRNLRFLRSYPSEVIWEPMTRMYHFGWKIWYCLRYSRHGNYQALV